MSQDSAFHSGVGKHKMSPAKLNFSSYSLTVIKKTATYPVCLSCGLGQEKGIEAEEKNEEVQAFPASHLPIKILNNISRIYCQIKIAESVHYTYTTRFPVVFVVIFWFKFWHAVSMIMRQEV